MGLRASWLVCLVLAGFVEAGIIRAEDSAPSVRDVLDRVAPSLATDFRDLPGAPGSFAGSVTAGLATCEQIELEVRVHAAGDVEVLAYPWLEGGRVSVANAIDQAAVLAKTAAPHPDLAPFAWVTGADAPLCARVALPADDAAAALERALLAVPAVDRATADLIPALGLKARLTEEELTAKLREAGTADVAERNAILPGLAPYLPELTPSSTPGSSTFRKLVMNRRGAAFDAFRFRVPAEGGDRRLVWAFALPPGTGKGWYIAPVVGEGPKFTGFHKASKLEGTDVPPEHAVLLQRSETPLRAGAEYILWFQFKVETPVEMYFALACPPFVASDRDGLARLSEVLGLKTK